MWQADLRYYPALCKKLWKRISHSKAKRSLRRTRSRVPEWSESRCTLVVGVVREWAKGAILTLSPTFLTTSFPWNPLRKKGPAVVETAGPRERGTAELPGCQAARMA